MVPPWSVFLLIIMSKDKKPYFPHYADIRSSDIRFMKLLKEQSWKGYGLYWGIVELLRVSDKYVLPRNFEILSNFFKCSSFLLKKIVEDYDLFVLYDDYFCCESLNDAMKIMEVKSAKGRVSASHRWDLEKKRKYGMSSIGDVVSNVPF